MAQTQTQSSGNGKGSKLAFKPTVSSPDTRANIPVGKWIDSIMPRGRFKVTATKGEEPMLNIPIKLGRADDDANESYQGAEETLRIVFYSDTAGEKTRAANMSKLRLRGLCEAVGVDYDGVYPASITSEDDLNDLISALENKKIPEMWTTHREGKMPSGETTLNVDLHFREPGAGLMKAGGAGGAGEDEEEDDTPARGKAKKAARR
jgi:hypothetical protein